MMFEVKGFQATRGDGAVETWIIENDAPIDCALIVRDRVRAINRDGNYASTSHPRVWEADELSGPFVGDLIWIDSGERLGLLLAMRGEEA